MKIKQAFGPFKRDKDSDSQVTVSMLIEMLQSLGPECQDYRVTYDAGCFIKKGELIVIPKDKEISING
jgi:hypothetical protein